MPGLVNVVDAYGQAAAVPEEQALAVLQSGGRLEAPEETASRVEQEKYGTVGQQAITAGESALSGATLGLSDVGLSEVLGDEYRTERAARERVNPLIATGSEVAGAIAPLIASGGTSAVARGASLIGAPTRAAAALGGLAERGVARGLGALGIEGTSVLGRGAATGARLAAGGAAEGALYGAGEALSEAALAPGGNYDHVGEKLWAGFKRGGGLGAIAGGGLGFVGGAASRAAERGMEKLVGADGLKALLERTAQGGVMKTVGVTARDAQRMGEPRIAKMSRDLLDHHLDDGARLFKAGDSAESLIGKVKQATQEVGQKLGKMRSEVDDFITKTGRTELGPDMKKFFREVDDMVVVGAAGPKMLGDRAMKAAEQFAPLRERWAAGDAITFGDVQKYRQEIDKILRPDRPTGGIVVAPESAAQLEAMRGKLEDVLEQSFEKASKAIGGDATLATYKELKGKYGSLSDANRLMKREAGRDIARNRFSPFETLSGLGGGIAAVASGSVVPFVAGAAYGAARKLMRERGESVIAVLADRLAKNDAQIGQGIKKFFRRASDTRRGVLGAGVGEELEGRSKTDRALGRRANETPGDAYRRRLQEAASITRDPVNALEGKLGTRIPTQAPRVAMAMSSAAARGEKFLLDKAPIGLVDTDALLPQMQPVDPDPVELARYARYVQVVDDPYSVLDEFADGTLTVQHTEALKTVYPEIFKDVQGRVWNQLAEEKELPPYEFRLQLGTLFDLPTDKSLRPESIAAAQAVYADRMERAQNPTPSKGGSMGLAKAYSTKIGELEGLEMEI